MKHRMINGPSGLRRLIAAGVLAALATQSLSLPASAATSQELFASPTGAGTACTSQSPCDLAEAQAKVRTTARDGAGITVTLLDGRYDQNKTLSFTDLDSGTVSSPVVWRAQHAGQAVVSGGTRIQSWKVQDSARGIYVAEVPKGSASRQLYIDGAWAPVAQASASELGFSDGWKGTATGYTVSNTKAVTWLSTLSAAEAASLEFVYTGKNGAWTQSRCMVQSVATSAGISTITMLPTCWKGMTQRPARGANESGGLPNMPVSTIPSYLANNYSLLSKGEWYLDSAAGKLYYAPQDANKIAALDITLPRLERLMTVAGSLTSPVHDLRFEGLRFSYATWLGPSSTGFAEVQSNLYITGTPSQGKCTETNPGGSCPYGALSQPLANIELSGSRNVSFTGNTFQGLGGAGLSVRYGATGTQIVGNHITETSGTGLNLGCTYDPQPWDASTHSVIKQNCVSNPGTVANDLIGDNEIVKNTYVANNVIHAVGKDYKAAPGVTILFGQDLQFVHNIVYDTPYSALTGGVIQGHATDSDNVSHNPNANARNVISFNLFYHYMQELKDGGAIYLEGHQGQYVKDAAGQLDIPATLANGMKVEGNVALQNEAETNFTYYDDAGSQFISWQGNVALNSFTGAGNSQGGCSAAGHLRVTNNYFTRPSSSYECQSAIDTVETGTTKIPVNASLADVPETIIAKAGLEPNYLKLSQTGQLKTRYTSTRTAEGMVLMAITGLNDDTKIYAGETQLNSRRIGASFVEVTVPAELATKPISVGAPDRWQRVNEVEAIPPNSVWKALTGRTFGDYKNDIYYATANEASLEFSFQGTRIRIHGETNSDQGNVLISIDGGPGQLISTYSDFRKADATIFESGALPQGTHTVKVVKKSGTYATFDGYSYLVN